MSEFVLEILNGDHAGDTFSLRETHVVLGRKPECTVVLADEKVSGKHAEIISEDGGHVLRDLDSTNGTLLDGRKVKEVALSAFDVVQLGRTRLVYRAADAASVAASQVEIHTVDHAALVRSGGRRGVLGMVVVLVLAAAVGGWFALQRGRNGRDGATAGRARRIAVVPGNKLQQAAAACEEAESWELQASGGGFQLGGPAHSGLSALEATRPEESADVQGGEAPPDHALARMREAVSVLPGEKLRLRGHLRTSLGGLGALRLHFRSSVQDEPEELWAGSEPVAHDAYAQVTVDATVPSGMDLVDVEVLALLPGANASVLADDISLVRGPGGTLFDQSIAGRHLVGTPAGLLVRSESGPVLLGLRPPASGRVAGLAKADLASFADAGQELALEPLAGGLAVSLRGGETKGFRFLLPRESAAAGVLTRGAEGGFVAGGRDLKLLGVREVLLGTGAQRLLLRGAGAELRGHDAKGRYVLELLGVLRLELILDFHAERTKARALRRRAEELVRAGKQGEALAMLGKIIEELPHDDAVLASARRRRAELLQALSRSLEDLRGELNEAEFFHARHELERAARRLDALLAGYGTDNLPQPAVVEAMKKQIGDQLAAFESAWHGERREQLGRLAGMFERSGQSGLASLVRQYLKKYHPAPPKPPDHPQNHSQNSGHGEDG